MITATKAGATPNLLKYRVVADAEGGEVVIDHATLLKDTTRGPLHNFIEHAIGLEGEEDACGRLLCNPSTRVFVTPMSFARVAVNAIVEGNAAALGLRILAEPNAIYIITLEYRHSLAA